MLCAQGNFNRVPDEEEQGVNGYWEGNQFSLGQNSYIGCQVPRSQSGTHAHTNNATEFQ